jgi:hypothetical protein
MSDCRYISPVIGGENCSVKLSERQHSTIINGALEEIMKSKYKHVDEHLCLRPFPQIGLGSLPFDEMKRKYREDMIQQAGIVVFIFGNRQDKQDKSKIILADGMIEEFEIAKEQGKIIIPVGSTGGASAKIYDEVKSNIKEYPYLEEYLKELGDETTNSDKLISLISKIISDQQIL